MRCEEEEVEEEGWFTRWQSALHLPLGTWVKACKRAGEWCGGGPMLMVILGLLE